MGRILLPFFFLCTAGAIFYFLTDPTYQAIKTLRAEQASYEEALANSKKLQSVRDKLLARYSAFPALSVERLEHMLPNNVDNVRLTLEIDRIASKYGMTVKDIQLSGEDVKNSQRDTIGSEKFYGTVILSFSVEGPYQNFVSFIRDLEKSLRIVDIINISFSAEEKSSQYNIKIKTYWLK